MFRDLSTYKYLNLLRELAIAQFKLKDQSAFLGFIWSFLHPLILLGVLFTMFRLRAGETIENYALYLLIGLVQYTHFSNSTSRSMMVLHSMKNLTADAIFPKEVLVLSSVMADAVELLLSMTICVLIAAVTGVALSWAILLLPFVWLLQLLLVSSVSLLLACLYVFIRDIAHIYEAFLRLLIFITPIFFDISFLGDGPARYVLLLNPLGYLISFSRSVIIQGTPFSLVAAMTLLAVTSLFFLFSLKIFKTYEPTFAERL
jgi:ABC-2 type transport system permease protein